MNPVHRRKIATRLAVSVFAESFQAPIAPIAFVFPPDASLPARSASKVAKSVESVIVPAWTIAK